MSADGIWYRLDNAGKLYPALLDRRRTTVFRLSVSLTKPIHGGLLQKALDGVMTRFPYFAVHLRKGWFWYSLASSHHQPTIERDSRYPCVRMPLKRRGVFPFRVRAWRNRIAAEFSHVLTDGTGASVFLKALVAEYLHLSGVPRRDDENLPRPGDKAVEGEHEDAFLRFANPALPPLPRPEPAFQLPVPMERRGVYRVITAIMPLRELKNTAAAYEASVTEFLVASMLDGYRRLVLDLPSSLRRRAIGPLRINVPVNLRRFWPSPTLRNFFVSVEPGIDLRLGDYDFEEIIGRTKLHLRHEVDRKYLSRRMSRNVRGEVHPAARLLPLAAKNLILPSLYALFAERLYTSGLSNLGLVTMPAHLAEYIRRFDFIPPPAAGERTKAGVIGWGDHLYMNFGRVIRPAVAELYVLRGLVKRGISVRVESN